MTLDVGQRWRYKSTSFDFIIEVLQVVPEVKTQILQANNYSTDHGYRVGRQSSAGGDGLSDARYHGDVWLYLEGQDKPK